MRPARLQLERGKRPDMPLALPTTLAQQARHACPGSNNTHILAWATLLHWHPPGCDETDIVTRFESRVTQLSLHVLLAVHKGVPLMK